MSRSNIEEHKFNDDLLANPGDLEKARTLYPELLHVLYHPELCYLFRHHDVPANVAKARSRRWGYVALALGLFALMTASAYPLYEDSEAAGAVGFAAAACGVLSVLVGYWGLLFGKAKRRWLHHRLMTERLRQFHFQTLVRRLPEVLESLRGAQQVEAYIRERAKWFTEFNAEHEGKLGEKISDLLEGGGRVWLHPRTPITPRELNNPNLGLVFRAYQKLRIEHQIGYASYMLREEGGRQTPPARQALVISRITFLAIISIFVIHLVVAFAIPLHSPLAHNSSLHIAAMWLALLGLGVRALAEGWQPEQELSRYRWYKASADDLRTRFVAEHVSPEERLRIMEEMERLTFEEMREFIRSNNRSRFVM